MTAGEFGIDRAAFLCQIRELDGPEDVIADSGSYSLGHLYGLIDRLRKIDTLTEQMMFEDGTWRFSPPSTAFLADSGVRRMALIGTSSRRLSSTGRADYRPWAVRPRVNDGSTPSPHSASTR
jgi:hypothetical protein